LTSNVIAINRAGFRLSRLIWNWQAHRRAVALTDFTRTFGRWSTCHLGKYDATVVWRGPGIRGDFTTLGGFPRPSDNACTAPAYVQPDTVDVFNQTWRTERGLHVGDSISRLHSLYPRASSHKD